MSCETYKSRKCPQSEPLSQAGPQIMNLMKYHTKPTQRYQWPTISSMPKKSNDFRIYVNVTLGLEGGNFRIEMGFWIICFMLVPWYCVNVFTSKCSSVTLLTTVMMLVIIKYDYDKNYEEWERGKIETSWSALGDDASISPACVCLPAGQRWAHIVARWATLGILLPALGVLLLVTYHLPAGLPLLVTTGRCMYV